MNEKFKKFVMSKARILIAVWEKKNDKMFSG